LIGTLVLERLEIGSEPLFIGGTHQIRVVDDPAAEHWEGGLGGCGREAKH